MFRIFIIVGLWLLVLMPASNALAQTSETPNDWWEAERNAQAVLDTSFNEMPPFEESGQIPDIGTLATVTDENGETVDAINYDTSRTWEAGALPADVVKVGDVETGLGAEQLTLTQIAELTGLNLDETTIGQLDFLQGTSLDKFLEEIPFLGEWEIEDIPEFESVPELAGKTGKLGEVVESVEGLGDMDVTEVFSNVPITSIPNMENSQLSDFDDIENQVISSIPGLGDIDLGSFPIPVAMPSLNFFPKQDLAFSKVEYSGAKSTPQPVSGGTNGNEVWMPMACNGGCPHIELADHGWEGANWMTKEHRVKDGFGFLGTLFDEAGAYRVPFGPSFALQVTETDEKTGKAEWGLAFRVCKRGIIDLGCTAYFMEVPLGIETDEGDTIITGVRDGLGGSSIPLDAPPGWEDMRPSTPSSLQQYVSGAGGAIGGASLCGEGPGGVDWDMLAKAYEEIESKGSGGYSAVGVWVNLSYEETGRAFGRYQYMSYRSDVVAAVSQRPGGSALLAKARQKYANISGAEMVEIFTPDMQDALFIADQTYMIELAMKKGYTGDRLLEVLSQMHFRGPGVLDSRQLDSKYTTDSLGTSLYEYGQRFRQGYRNIESKSDSEDNKCKATGTFINPVYNGAYGVTSVFSPARDNPVTGDVKAHNGDDFGTPVGTKIVASDGGVIEHMTGGGFGWWIILHHGKGEDGTTKGEDGATYETWYAHLSKYVAGNGSKVAQGDVIALSGGEPGQPGAGRTTGPHLHFEVRRDGIAINPPTVVDYTKTNKDVGK